MPVDASVLGALEQALAASPENVGLRLHLATLLLDAGRAADALTHGQVILAARPDHIEALQLTALAAERVGDASRAQSYRRLATALGPPASAAVAPVAVTPAAKPTATPAPPRGEVVPLRIVAKDEALAEEESWRVERPPITLADVAGLAAVKRRLELAFLGPLKNPALLKMYGKSLRGGLLLYGPPGCGKTFIARAVAGELGAAFIGVGLSDVLDMWLGQSEKNLHEIFESARRSAPCVLFFDEIDAIGRKRSLQRESAGRSVVTQLLSELDSVGANNDGVFVLAATNHPWDVDTALRRPGRLDRMLLVLPPDEPARAAILRVHLRARPVDAGVDVDWLAARTADFSGADLAHLCDSAAELALEDAIATGDPRSLTMADFKRALKDVKGTTRPWFETARNFAQFANEGGVYDDLCDYLRQKKLL